MTRFFVPHVHQADPGASTGNPVPPTTTAAQPPALTPTPAAPAAVPQTPADPTAPLQGILSRHQGDPFAVIATLMGENAQLRETRRTLQGQIPAHGAVVLSGEDATRWQAYSAMGAPADLQTALTERDQARTELGALKRDLELRDVAAIGDGTQPYKLAVLKQLVGAAEFVIKDELANGQTVRKVFVKDGDKETPLGDYAKAKWPDFLPALQAGAVPSRAIGTPTRTAQSPVQPQTQTQEPARRRISL